MCLTQPDEIVSAHLLGVASCLIIGPLLCALVIYLWPSHPPRDYRGDKHW